MRPVLRVATYPFIFVKNVYWEGLNERNLLTLPLNFLWNFSPVALWLAIFKNAGLIPHEWRPKIHYLRAKYFDDFFFGARRGETTYDGSQIITSDQVYYWSFVTALCAFFLLCGLSFGAYRIWQARCHSNSREFAKSNFELVSTEEESFEISEEPLLQVRQNSVQMAAFFAILPLSWMVLNVDHAFAGQDHYTQFQDILGWYFYVAFHAAAPILTAIYLYAFHVPGTVAAFSWSLGLQNIAGVLTHLVFPNAAPWFIHLYGTIDPQPSYDTPGYAAGLVRADKHMGTDLAQSGFHILPIVFGAMPSLHSAMAVQVGLYLVTQANQIWLRLVGLLFVCIPWWATMYLDHHFRGDLFVGECYALIAFVCVYKFYLEKKKIQFYEAEGELPEGGTMGMRVFRDTWVQPFFDPR